MARSPKLVRPSISKVAGWDEAAWYDERSYFALAGASDDGVRAFLGLSADLRKYSSLDCTVVVGVRCVFLLPVLGDGVLGVA